MKDYDPLDDYNELLGRRELAFELPDLSGKRVLVTGSGGFLGPIVSSLVGWCGGKTLPCDLPGRDILSDAFLSYAENADAFIHLAAHKMAYDGEVRPESVSEVNVRGTANVVRAAQGKPIVFSSTCKACDPCTVYGASKLIGERLVLNAGGTVVRLVNVVGSPGQVPAIWHDLPPTATVPVSDCTRMWMSPLEAASSLVHALSLEPGRYVPKVPPRESMFEFARRAMPGRELRSMPLRRGDRYDERLVSEYEQRVFHEGPLDRVMDLWEGHEAVDEVLAEAV
jgi:FlaA1/EpsC-like NDP-sugar epimerase